MLRYKPHSVPLLLTLLLSMGCTDSGDDEQWQQYLTRLGRTLDVNVPDIADTTVPVPPRPGQIQVDIPPGSLGSLDFLAISGCAVQVTIGKRNSSLGRLAAPSQRLLLELEYLQLAPECIEYQREQGKENLATTLETAWELKREQLPARIYNATLASAEYRQFWRPGREAGIYPAVNSSQVLQALGGINAMASNWLAGDYRADNREFETLLGEVAGGDGGKLLAALAEQGEWLRAANSMLDESRAAGPLCGPGYRRDPADILPVVVRKFFVEGVQVQAAALGRRYFTLMEPLRELEALLGNAAHPDYLEWIRVRDALLNRVTQAPRIHVGKLQTVMGSCGSIAPSR